MTNLEDIRDYIQGNLMRVLALALIALCGIGVMVFAVTNVLPAWKAHNELVAQVISAQDSLQAQQDAGLNTGDVLRKQAELMQTRVAEQAIVFLTEKEASQVLANLYGYAKDAGTQVIDLQAQPSPKQDTKTAATSSAPLPYIVRVFRLTVSGEADSLVNFLARFREAALPGVSLSNLKIDAKDGATTLVVDVTMYTSPFAPGNTLVAQTGSEPPPLPLPVFDTATPSAEPATAVVALSEPVSGSGLSATPTPTGRLSTTADAGASLTPPAQTAAPVTDTPGTPAPAEDTAPAITVQSLLQELDKQWEAENWPTIITISQQILTIDPTTAGLSVKLYSAHTNYGYQLASQGKIEQARAEFNAALAINPDGAAALAGLKLLANSSATPAPAVKIYVVQWGDTLANLAIHFNVSVQALKAANHLLDDRIYAGQELIIPG